jgi:multidrug efflux pump subunit AcrA (membrane-fusion protein)
MKYLLLLVCLGICCAGLPVTPYAEGEETADASEADQSTDIAKAADLNGAAQKSGDKAEATDAKKTESDEKADTKSAADAEESAKKDADKKAEAKKKSRKTHAVKPKRLKVDVSLDGTFVAEKMTEVALRPDAWSQYEIVEVVEHGAKVHAGETLVKFDAEKINESIADLDVELHLSELAIRRGEEELPRLEKLLAMTAADAERTDREAKEDYDRYHKTDRPMILKSIGYSLKYAQFNLDYAQDELDQLEKMYEADDLTEETEEIVLKRQRNQVDFAKFNLESTQLYRDQLLAVGLPRNDIRIKNAVDRAKLDLAKAQTALALDLNRARYELEKQKQSRAKSLDRHVKLLADRDLMEIKAPVEGVVYFGQCVDGSWPDMATMIKKLEPHGSVSGGTVMMTIVEPRPMHVLAMASEDKRPDLAAGQSAKLTPPGDDSEPIAAKVKSISTVPVASGKFAAGFDVTGSDLPEWVVPGVSGKLKVTTYDKSDAITVPKKAVHTDDEDEDVKYVWRVDPEDDEAEPERRTVKTGKTSGDDVEVLKGLKAGDVVSLEDESKKDADK